jgi:hypothetical protein
MSRPRTVALVVSLLVLSSCAGSMAQQNVAIFHDAQRRYTRLMRFSDWEKAGRYVAPDTRQVFRSETAALGDLRFSDYEIQEVEAFGDTATALVAYTGWRASSPTVVTYLEEQQWELADGAWVVRPRLEPQP